MLFDVDFTLVRPGPDLGPEGYVRLGERHGLRLDVSRHDEARLAAFAELKRHPELEHDDEVWIVFTERIIRGMGGDAERAYECAAEMVAAWEDHDNFELYDDALPVLGELRGRGLKLGLVSNTSRDLEAFVVHHRLEVDVAIGSRSHGKTKPDPTIFRAALDRLAVEPGAAAMVGDSVEDDIEGALALGMRAILLDREGRYPELEPRITGLGELLPALGPLEPELLPPGRGVLAESWGAALDGRAELRSGLLERRHRARRRPPRRRRARATRRAGVTRAARRAPGSSGSNARPAHSSWPSTSQRRCQKRGSSAATVRKRPSAVG